MAKIGALDKAATRRSIGAIVEVLLGFAEPQWDVVGDLEAGLTTPFERYHWFATRPLSSSDRRVAQL